MDLEGAIRLVVEASGLELFDLTFHHGSGRALLRVTVDREGGVDLDTIAQVSERISRRLDVEGFDPGPYSLEVTSPGVERPLRGPRDFAGRVGERVKVKTAEPVDGTRSFTGTLVAAGDRVVRIATEQGERTLSFDDIASARTVADWEAELKERGKKR
ncbi:MAG: ribosome maturation factor RimP [Actinobacteria bacterium]|nr:MAG: ribosome maturation factor RimP [Actinomycetota bacterium]TMK96236.1 MAG: ribosome maturation factor RimP [Actinomycetota bacterium]